MKTILFMLCSILPIALWANWNDVESGTLLLQFGDAPEQWVAPSLNTDVDIKVSGPVVRATVSQIFRNPGSEWANATYVFPLPETAAVDQMRLEVGERIIEGQIKEKTEAKAIFEAAKNSGHKASLITQERSNLFTTHIANIPPGESVTVRIQYQHSVDRIGHIYSLRFPMTLTPRYIPGARLVIDAEGQNLETDLIGTSATTNTTATPDADAISPPWAMQWENTNPTRIRVDLQPGFALDQVESLYHSTNHYLGDQGSTIIELDNQDHAANADFILQWQAADSLQPQVQLFTEILAGESYSLLLVSPPGITLTTQMPAREIVFVIDTSGSMGGEPLRQAKKALLWALGRLQAEDSFNIIEFNSGHWRLFGRAKPASSANIDKAKQFVGSLDARGGTEMLAAMDSALCGYCAPDQKVRQVIFLTDGAIGNEEQLFELIKHKVGNSRLFTVGIGSAPNTFFMRKAAEAGRGTFTYIADSKRAGETMAGLFSTLEKPLLTDIAIHSAKTAGEQPALEILPNPIPDIYADRPAIILLRGNLPGALSIRGKLAGQTWRKTLASAEAITRPGIQTLWGRQQIEQLTDRQRYSSDSEEKTRLREEITQTALRHHLVSHYTSLVAVDITPARSEGENSQQHQIPNNSPNGSHFGLAATATSAPRQFLLGGFFLIAAFALFLAQRPISNRQAQA